MSHQSIAHEEERASVLAEVKRISGRRIEVRRRAQRKSQRRLAAEVGIGVRWLREIESGSPKSRIDEHIRCAHVLGLSSAFLLIPMLLLEHRLNLPRQFLGDDMDDAEVHCYKILAAIDMIPLAHHHPVQRVRFVEIMESSEPAAVPR
ncbi:helix-turn-helix domain-containing protein [Sphingomonas sp. YL-JM2C]